MINISVLGSTGSIGIQTLEVVRKLGLHRVIGLATYSNINLLENQIREFNPRIAAVYDEENAEILKYRIKDTATKVYSNLNGLIEVASHTSVSLCVVSLLGLIGLLPTISAIENGIDIAIATKEILVSAGHILTILSKKYNVNIIPIDSEHNAIYQCLKARDSGVNRLILTGSGGPFRGKIYSELKNAKVEEALNHPTWSMGKKISIDSSTLMNKGLEVIEARWLFDTDPCKISVLIHPQSIVHSMVEYDDGSIMAIMGARDMKIPIGYAITNGMVCDTGSEKSNLLNQNLTFEEPDKNFNAIELAYDALNIGGSMPTVLSSSNDAAVGLFLEGKIGFLEITRLVEVCMKRHTLITNPDIDDVLATDKWAKNEVLKMLN